jgi:hypothetical protein
MRSPSLALPWLFAAALLLGCSTDRPRQSAGADSGPLPPSEADCAAVRARRSGPHEVWSAACGGARIGQEYRNQPPVCYPTDPLCDCVLADYCLSPADCTAKPGGICKGSTLGECIDPGSDEGKSCELDSECTFRSGGACRPRIAGGDVLCDRTGKCETIPSYSCAYFPYVSDCHRDADCTAAPGGACRLSLGTECLYNECQVDSDCGPMARCDCQDVRRCVPAQCFSEDDCAGLACSPSLALQCGNIYPPVGYYCRTAQDECQSDDDCMAACAATRTSPPCGSSCVYDPAVSHWACRGVSCLTR